MNSPAVTHSSASFSIRKNTLLMALIVYFFVTLQKPLSHMYVVTMIYMFPPDFLWKYLIAFCVGCLGVVLVFKGLKMDEVKGSLMGLFGGILVWDSWFEMGLDFFEHQNAIPMIKDAAGTPALLGSHVILEMSGLFLIITLIITMFQKDMRCRMLLWIRKTLGFREGIGKPTQGLKPQTARIAFNEYLYVTWFMYVLMITTLDPRVAGLNHVFTYVLSAAILVWSLFLLYKQSKQNEVGLMIRYAIGAAGVSWYNFEIATLWGLYSEYWVRPDQNPISCLLTIAVFIVLARFIWLTPVNPETGKSAK
ncbi:hypothetical protein [Paraglaciecola hydrolytica]|uniref:Uncharacterized protein n=1 Tax=Paraglaciecola hydrolytica TaxID=1799789 RepID=A0A136A5J0_9ALTE|nr:hypothetical protein [Paraglaciecola hydrolytica]KXI30474.1 hypothetical protein AX660_10955 [Paraglaciecola hydrolytica]